MLSGAFMPARVVDTGCKDGLSWPRLVFVDLAADVIGCGRPKALAVHASAARQQASQGTGEVFRRSVGAPRTARAAAPTVGVDCGWRRAQMCDDIDGLPLRVL
jgi:hypothetical protein